MLIFAYQSTHLTEITSSVQFENNDGVKKKFNVFKLPTWISRALKFDLSNNDYCVFYTKISEFSYLNNFYKVVQDCQRAIGRYVYYSIERFTKTNTNDEFLFDLQFCDNKDYYWKSPNGSQLSSEIDKLILITVFIIYQKSKPSIRMLDYFLTEVNRFYEIEKKKLLNKHDAINSMLKFVNLLSLNRGDVHQETNVSYGAQTLVITCFLGCIDSDSYLQHSQNQTLSQEFIKYLLEYLYSKDDLSSKMREYEMVLPCFLRGVEYCLYACISSEKLVGYLIPLIRYANYFPDFKMEVTILKFIEKSYLINGSYITQNKKTFENQLKSYEQIEQNNIFSTLLDLCEDFEGVFSLIDNFLEVLGENQVQITMTTKQDNLIKNRLLKYQKKTTGLKLQLYKFLKYEKCFDKDKVAILVYFFQNIDDKQIQLVILVKLNDLKMNDSLQLKKICTKLSENIKKYYLADLLSIIQEICRIESNEQFVLECKTKFKEEILDRIEFDPDFHSEKILNSYLRFLKNRSIFKFGCLKEFNKYIRPKLRSFGELMFFFENLIIEQYDCCESNELKLIINSVWPCIIKEQHINYVAILFKKIQNKIDDKMFVNELFESYLQILSKGINFSKFISLANFDIFLTPDFEDAFIKVLKKDHLDNIKNKKIYEIVEFIKDFFTKLNNIQSNSLKRKLIVNVFSMPTNNDDEWIKSVKDLIIYNPDRNHFLFILLDYSLIYNEIRSLPFINPLKKNICILFDEIELRNLNLKDVEALEKLIKQPYEDKINIVKDYARMCFDIRNLPDVKTAIINCVYTTNNIISKLTSAKDFVDFLKKFEFDVNQFEDPILRMLECKDTHTVNQIEMPLNGEILSSMAEFYQNVKRSSVFEHMFKNNYKIFKEINEESLNQMRDLFLSVYKNLGEKLERRDELDIKFFKEWFSQLKSKEQIRAEIDVLKSFVKIEIDLEDFLISSLFNISKMKSLKDLIENVINCFAIFGVNNGDIKKTTQNYYKISEQENFKILQLNQVI